MVYQVRLYSYSQAVVPRYLAPKEEGAACVDNKILILIFLLDRKS